MEDARVVLTPLDGRYPSRLRGLATPPASLIVQGGALDAERVVAIVGSRSAHEESLKFAAGLGNLLAGHDVVVVSGGARGVDAAAHGGVLAAGGRTWVVAGTDPDSVFPPEHAELFQRVARGPGAMIWPFDRRILPANRAFPERNRILIALADAVVVVQAARQSGALNAAGWARRLGKPLWVVAVSPWQKGKFEGSRALLDDGAHPLTSELTFVEAIRAPRRTSLGKAAPDAPQS